MILCAKGPEYEPECFIGAHVHARCALNRNADLFYAVPNSSVCDRTVTHDMII